MAATDYFVWGWIAHTAGDWAFQSEWMAKNKVSLRHPAAWIHSGIHLVAALLVFPAPLALLVAVLHLLIDTRVPLQKWRLFFRQTSDPANPVFIPFAMHQDQAAHVLVLALAAWLTKFY